jgi:hypothetical protein
MVYETDLSGNPFPAPPSFPLHFNEEFSWLDPFVLDDEVWQVLDFRVYGVPWDATWVYVSAYANGGGISFRPFGSEILQFAFVQTNWSGGSCSYIPFFLPLNYGRVEYLAREDIDLKGLAVLGWARGHSDGETLPSWLMTLLGQ